MGTIRFLQRQFLELSGRIQDSTDDFFFFHSIIHYSSLLNSIGANAGNFILIPLTSAAQQLNNIPFLMTNKSFHNDKSQQ